MSEVNRRITWLILVFVFLSLAGSVLPLIAGVGDILPLPLMGRDSALGLHTLVLMAYMAFVFPLSILAPPPDLGPEARRRWDLAWWWVGGFILAFSGVPLFVLAYIAGVHLKAVVAVLAWAGVFHGLAILWTRLFGHRSRPLLVVLNFLLAVPITAVDFFARRLGAGVDWWSPFALVRAMTLEFAEPDLVLPIGLVLATSLAVVLPARFVGRAARAALLLAPAVLVLAAGQGGGEASARLPAGDLFVPGRPLPIELVAQPGASIEIDVAGRERIRWAPRPGEPERRFAHPLILQAGERILVRDGEGRTLLDRGIAALPGERRLALVLGEVALAWPEAVDVVRGEPRSLDDSAAGLGLFSAIVLGRGVEAGLAREQRRALLDYAAEGGTLITPEGEGQLAAPFGRGRRVLHGGSGWPLGLVLDSREEAATEANLYSSFALPDWGRVPLGGLVAFLGLYHLVFYLIFLLPLLLDGRKALGVYLVSVAFVLALVVAGAYLVLKRVFLAENQILQQNVGVFVMTDQAGAGPLLLEQATCFASFNGSPATLDFALADEPVLLYPPGARGPGLVELAPDGMRLPELELDRRAAKQMVRLGARADAPVALRELGGGGFELEDRLGAVDRFGLRSARIVGAFLRRDGRLHAVAVTGRILVPAAEPAELHWHGVVPESLRAESIPFLARALGRSAPREGAVMGLLLEGARLLHGDEPYLQRRDVVQLLLVPLAP